MNRTRSSARGFTLIEFLVVIAIIAILAAILFPVFAQARDKARASVCLSNAKQLALAFHMYAQDYDERTVISYYGGGPSATNPPGHYNWVKLLGPYVKSKDVYWCPSGPNSWDAAIYPPNSASCRATTVAECEYQSVISYGINGYVANKSLASVDRPADTLAICETRYYYPGHPSYNPRYAGWTGAYPSNAAIDPGANIPGWTYSKSLIAKRHNEGNNVCFADGHAKWMRWDVITDPSTAKTLWNAP